MERNIVRFVLFAGLIVAGYVGLADPLRADGGDKTEPLPQMAPEWNLKDLDGKDIKLSDFKGKVVILDFWATWCGPCKLEIPGFVSLQKEYADRGLMVIGISLDEGDPKLVKSFAKRMAMNYPVLLGNNKITSDYGGIEAIPTTLIIDQRGMIIGKHVGYVEKQEFESEIKKLLKL
jgi:peroxiredoxin